MDPFSITAGVVGIVAPTLHCVRLLIDDLQNIANAPEIQTPRSYHWYRHPQRCCRRLTPARPWLDGTGDQMDRGFEDDVAILRDYCLIAADKGGEEFEMHGLVQLSTRRWLEAFKQQETFKQQYIERIAASFPTGEYKNWATCRTLFAHVQVALGYRPSKATLDAWANLLHNGGCYADSQGKYEVAQQMMLGEARRVREKKLGKKATATLHSTSIFAVVLHHQGRWKEAKSLEVQVMETSSRVLGEEHPDTLTSMNNLAFTLKGQGRQGEALDLMKDCAQIRQRVLGPEHPYTVSSLAVVEQWSI